MLKRPAFLAVFAALATALAFAIAGIPSAQAAGPVRIMTLGDSITGSPGCWRQLLWTRLQNNGFTNIDMVGTLPPQGCGVPYDGENEGHGGALVTTVADQNQLVGWLSATLPDIVVMHFGTNDVWSARTTAQILAAYSKLVDQMRVSNPNMKILVAKIIPVAPPSCPECPARTVDLNNAIPGWASGKTTAQSPITVVDQWTGWNASTDTSDGVHPNASGNQKLSDKWYPALSGALNGSATTPPPDIVPPTVPGTPTAINVTATSVSMSWTASTDNVGVVGYDIFRAVGASGGTFTPVGTSASNSFTNVDLIPSTTYRYQVRAKDAAGAVSQFSGTLTVTTPPGNVCGIVPPAPANLTASNVSQTSVNLNWGVVVVPGCVFTFDILRAPGASGGTFTVIGTSMTNAFTNFGLTPNTTYRFQARTRDQAGNVSAVSNTVTVTTLPSTTGGCTATYRIVNPWPGAFQGEVTVANTGTATINSWTVLLTFPSGVTITQMWGGTFSPASGTVTVRPTYNATVGAGQSTTFGFIANASGSSGATATATCTTS